MLFYFNSMKYNCKILNTVQAAYFLKPELSSEFPLLSQRRLLTVASAASEAVVGRLSSPVPPATYFHTSKPGQLSYLHP